MRNYLAFSLQLHLLDEGLEVVCKLKDDDLVDINVSFGQLPERANELLGSVMDVLLNALAQVGIVGESFRQERRQSVFDVLAVLQGREERLESQHLVGVDVAPSHGEIDRAIHEFFDWLGRAEIDVLLVHLFQWLEGLLPGMR